METINSTYSLCSRDRCSQYRIHKQWRGFCPTGGIRQCTYWGRCGDSSDRLRYRCHVHCIHRQHVHMQLLQSRENNCTVPKKKSLQ